MSEHLVIDLTQAQVGMVLAQDVVNATGQTLAAAGTLLTVNLIEGLRARGVEHLVVRTQEDAAARAALRDDHIAYLFRNSEGDALRLSLRRALEQYRREKDAVC